ncbi:vpu protein [Simian immunodeficiency virus]|uniref:Protein Vpu n=2 Tax=Simian immunodeficiency virus TaxID=11723 RepID=Q1A235_SIV|nr:vpu protein [Simian immunodeficiency virus]AFJ52185.1 vpu protein [Simian immunodeficiency virus]WLD25277.1 vpu protein [Simian-Chimpanzee immunodeficiency virus]WLD25287.1 vpu protein [Simian-Chimpanzee immunodeficiency virus]WLD25297.1 vpu protein [Simian-Chimpanzee immunodeficiency virus]
MQLEIVLIILFIALMLVAIFAWIAAYKEYKKLQQVRRIERLQDRIRSRAEDSGNESDGDEILLVEELMQVHQHQVNPDWMDRILFW